MRKLIAIALYCILGLSIAFAYTPISRQRNFVNDASNSIPITASYVDAELNNLVSAANGTLIAQGSAPSSPFEGMYWYNTTSHVLEVYRNNEWILVNPIHSGSVMATPQNNDLWVNAVNGMNHLKLFDNNVNGGNWEDIPAIKNLKANVFPWYDGINWNEATINKGVNWSSISPVLFNGTNWDDPSYSPGASKYWQYQGFGSTPVWTANPVFFVPNNIQVFTSTGTWTKPSNVLNVYVKVIGGGGAGWGNTSTTSGGGGGGGGYAEGIIAVTGNVTVTIGSTNSFAGTTTIQATKGTDASNSTGAAGGTGSNGTINLTGQQGGTGISGLGGFGGSSFMGANTPQATGLVGRNGSPYGGGGSGTGSASGSATSGDVGAVIVYY